MTGKVTLFFFSFLCLVTIINASQWLLTPRLESDRFARAVTPEAGKKVHRVKRADLQEHSGEPCIRYSYMRCPDPDVHALCHGHRYFRTCDDMDFPTVAI
ncbi:hypothetical protein SK128_006429 [Halocaridina rubra]|uniref:Uncharacterized protein n=1 Tax=Halocaridina rubra TaxID=373956 RepID=A0AAN8WAU1_HALRR